MSNALAIILARRASRGLPGKNWAPVAGRPCVCWTIDDALSARGIERVLVSTDAPEVAQIARSMGVAVCARPDHLANDSATVDDAARHALHTCAETHTGPIVLLYANVPLRPPTLIDRALDLLESTACDSVQSYAPVGKHHPWWTCRLDTDARVRPFEGDRLHHGVHRRQDLPPACIPDGGVLCLTRDALELRVPGAPEGPHAFLGADHRGIPTAEGEVVDIDTRIDLLVADAILRERTGVPAGDTL